MITHMIKKKAADETPPVCIDKSTFGKQLINFCTLQYYCPQPIINARLAHAYVPYQYLFCLYPPNKGLMQGTVFPELDRPYGSEPEYTIDE